MIKEYDSHRNRSETGGGKYIVEEKLAPDDSYLFLHPTTKAPTTVEITQLNLFF